MKSRWNWAGTPAVVIVAICSALPLAWMAIALLANPQVRGEFHLTVFRSQLLERTLGYNFLAGVIATAMGLPAAFVLGRGRGWLARVLWVALPAALLLPSLSFAYGWSQVSRLIAAPLGWIVAKIAQPGAPWLARVGLALVIDQNHPRAGIIPSGPADIFRCIWSLGTWLWAVPATLIGLCLRRMDTTVQQQAVLDGALLRVTLRQLSGPMIASIAIVTILATQEFAVYEPTGISVVATEVRMVFDTGSLSGPDNSITVSGYLGAGAKSPDQAGRAAAAVATVTPLLIVTAILAALAFWGIGRQSDADAISIGDWPRVLDTSVWAKLIAILLVALNIGIPVWALLDSLRVGFSPSRMMAEFGPQVYGASLVAIEAASVALIAAMFSAAARLPGLLAIAAAGFLVGGQLLAIGLIRIYNRPGLFWAYNCSVVPVIAYLGRFGWLAIAAGRATWTRPWREMREMASLDGATPMQIVSRVVWPLGWPILLAGGLLVGALSLTEVPATVLLMPQNPQVLTPTLMTWVHMARFDPMIEASLLMMGMVIIPAVAGVVLASVGIKVLKKT